jgi:hypothetical protein
MMSKFKSKIKPDSDAFRANAVAMDVLVDDLRAKLARLAVMKNRAAAIPTEASYWCGIGSRV